MSSSFYPWYCCPTGTSGNTNSKNMYCPPWYCGQPTSSSTDPNCCWYPPYWGAGAGGFPNFLQSSSTLPFPYSAGFPQQSMYNNAGYWPWACNDDSSSRITTLTKIIGPWFYLKHIMGIDDADSAELFKHTKLTATQKNEKNFLHLLKSESITYIYKKVYTDHKDDVTGAKPKSAQDFIADFTKALEDCGKDDKDKHYSPVAEFLFKGSAAVDAAALKAILEKKNKFKLDKDGADKIATHFATGTKKAVLKKPDAGSVTSAGIVTAVQMAKTFERTPGDQTVVTGKTGNDIAPQVGKGFYKALTEGTPGIVSPAAALAVIDSAYYPSSSYDAYRYRDDNRYSGEPAGYQPYRPSGRYYPSDNNNRRNYYY
jgi:hypothetical protein